MKQILILKGIEGYINESAPVVVWESEDILLDAIGKLNNIPQWECNFVSRICNKSVDKLAKFSRKFGITRVWSEQPPNVTESQLLLDCESID